ncbi:Uma2 family endonuclease [Okeania sp.]|uniref:Uma2 family endonuclease n=1 Tax=Okeania sp. TaxID=3100323 RepID=UPI002B4B1FEC|nr:Uma2 family endonuclease [Okeania sp.]MEB3342562.1 Uma2 family endonuclease [Okeania sp.]
MVLQIQPTKSEPTVTWTALPEDYILPDDPVENIQQPLLAAALTEALTVAKLTQPQMLIGSNFGLVATVNDNIIVKAPDWFYVPEVEPVDEGVIRRSYTPNLQGKPVAIVMEFLSHKENDELSGCSTLPYGKLYFYEQILKVPTYVIYNPYKQSIEVRRLESGKYKLESPNEKEHFWIPELELFLGIWKGERLGQNINWLRWWDKSENLLLWSEEKNKQAEQRVEQEKQRADLEKQRAERLVAKLRDLGIDPDSL